MVVVDTVVLVRDSGGRLLGWVLNRAREKRKEDVLIQMVDVDVLALAMILMLMMVMVVMVAAAVAGCRRGVDDAHKKDG